MTEKAKKSIFVRLRNYFITGAIVLIPIGITIYLTLIIIRISSNFLPKKINPNNYLPFDIPGIEILITIILITLIGSLSLSFLGKKFLEIFNSKIGMLGLGILLKFTRKIFPKIILYSEETIPEPSIINMIKKFEKI